MYQVEQRADGWYVIMSEGKQTMGACFSDRATAQMIADTMSPALHTIGREGQAKRNEQYAGAKAS